MTFFQTSHKSVSDYETRGKIDGRNAYSYSPGPFISAAHYEAYAIGFTIGRMQFDAERAAQREAA
jgi:hypothetical protein